MYRPLSSWRMASVRSGGRVTINAFRGSNRTRSIVNERIDLKSPIQNKPAGSAATCRLPGTYFRTQCFGLYLTSVRLGWGGDWGRGASDCWGMGLVMAVCSMCLQFKHCRVFGTEGGRRSFTSLAISKDKPAYRYRQVFDEYIESLVLPERFHRM